MSAQLVKELRERTGAGMLDCMNAIKATNGDIEKAIVWLQEKGISKAAKKAGAVAAEGVVAIVENDKKIVIYEVNSQTDFVATNDEFKNLVKKIGDVLIKNDFNNVDEANALKQDGKSIADLCLEATAKIGEKIVLRRVLKENTSDLVVGSYVHVNKRIAAVVLTKGGSEEAARNVAMHVASMNPKYLDEKSVPAEQIKAFKAEIAKAPALQTKPEKIRESIANGMLRKQLSELTLVDQEFVMEKMPVSKYLAGVNAEAKAMLRLEVGEGLEKGNVNFADEVKAQMNNN